MALLDTVAQMAEGSGWRSITLLEVAEHATLITDDSPLARFCTCEPEAT
jgi:hypothetical protein